jgi:hypothetical protein
MLRIITVAAAAALVALTTTGASARSGDECDAVTKRALLEFKSTLDRHKERWVELQGIVNETDPVALQLCNFNKLLLQAPAGNEAKD